MKDRSAKAGGYTPRKFVTKKYGLILMMLVFVLGGISAGVLLKTSKEPSFCASCHIIKPHYQSWNEGPLLAAKHADQNVECLDCHEQSISEKVREGAIYVVGNYENPLEERDFAREDCLECHQENWNQIVAATNFTASNPHDNHLGEIDCNLCHKMHRESEVYCVQCHEFEWFESLDEKWKV